MRKLTLLLIALITASCSSLFLGMESPRIHLANLEMKESTLFEQNFLAILRVQNPNNVDIPVTGLKFDLEINGKHFATGLSSTETLIPRLGSTTIEVAATSTLLSIIRQLNSLREEGKKTVDYRLSGKLHTSALRSLSFKYTGDIDLDKLGQTTNSAPASR